MQKQLTICLGLIVTPLTALVLTACDVSTAGFDSRGGSQLTIQVRPTTAHPNISSQDFQAVQKVIENRVNGLNIPNALIQSIGNNQILVQLPGVKDTRQAERVLGRTAQLEFREQKAGTEEQLSAELVVLRETQAQQALLNQSKSPNKSAIFANRVAIEKQYTEIGKLFKKATLSGKHLKNAVAQPVSSSGWEIEVEFDNFGNAAFAKLTKQLAGTGLTIGVFLDRDPVMTPIVGPQFAATGITGGKAVITGKFTAETANDLVVQLTSGSLPVPVEIVEIRTVPPK